MRVLNQLTSLPGERGEEANIRLAETIAAAQDAEAVQELIAALPKASAALSSDIIKTLYEIGKRQPALISQYADVFLGLLRAKNNRLVWGGMMALETIADRCADALFGQVKLIEESIQKGSVITRDAGIGALARLAAAKPEYAESIMPFLLEHLRACRPASVAQHAEKTFLCVSPLYAGAFAEVLRERLPDLSEAQAQRVNKLLKKTMKAAK